MMLAVSAGNPDPGMNKSQIEIAKVCDQIKDLLISKNLKYGDSALNPNRIFSKASTVEQILVRIDDKLNRIQKGVGLLASDEDVVNDLIGYLILLKIAMSKQKINTLRTDLKYEKFVNGYYGEDPWDGVDIEPANQYINSLKVACPD